MKTCKLCESAHNVEEHHIIPQALSDRRFRLFGVRGGIALFELKKANETVPLCRRCHLVKQNEAKELLRAIFIASVSKCLVQPCLYERKCGAEVRTETNCVCCKVLRQFDLLNFYDWFAQDFDLLPIHKQCSYNLDFWGLPDDKGVIHLEFHTIPDYFDEALLEYLRLDL